MSINPYESPKGEIRSAQIKADTGQWRSVFVALVSTVALTCVAFNVGMAFGLSSSPSIPSIPNLWFASIAGAACGGFGALPVCLLVYLTGPTIRLAAIVLGSACWAGVTGLSFSHWVAMVASC